MAATVDTKEQFPAGTEEKSIIEEQKLRIKAGAIKCEYSGSKATGWVLTTTWNVIGEQ